MKPLIIIAALALAGCSTTSSGSFCQIAPHLKYHQKVYDAMDDAEAAKTLAYLKTGETLCRWKP
jgi:hypothetical protein